MKGRLFSVYVLIFSFSPKHHIICNKLFTPLASKEVHENVNILWRSSQSLWTSIFFIPKIYFCDFSPLPWKPPSEPIPSCLDCSLPNSLAVMPFPFAIPRVPTENDQPLASRQDSVYGAIHIPVLSLDLAEARFQLKLHLPLLYLDPLTSLLISS